MNITFSLGDGLILFLLLVSGLGYWHLLRNENILAQDSRPDEAQQIKPSGLGLYPARLIRQAGFLPKNFAWGYWVFKLLFAILLPLLLNEFGRSSMGGWPYSGAALVGFFLLDLWLLIRRARRKTAIRYAYGYYLDLLIPLLRSGMALENALERARVLGLPASNPLRHELHVIASEIEAGKSRSEAAKPLYDRTGVEELQSFALMIGVGYQIGGRISDALDKQGELHREQQRERGLKLVQRKSMEALLPLMLVSFPLVGVFVFYPAVMEIITSLRAW